MQLLVKKRLPVNTIYSKTKVTLSQVFIKSINFKEA